MLRFFDDGGLEKVLDRPPIFEGCVMEGWPVRKPIKFSKEVIDELEPQALGDFGIIQDEKTPALGVY
jgi:hypothetical protein